MPLRATILAILVIVVASSVAAAPPAAPKPQAPASSTAALPATPIAFGESFPFDSGQLGARRPINVYLPPGYAAATERYPVLYLVDGAVDEDFAHVAALVDVEIRDLIIRPIIVVGVAGNDRRHDLVRRSDNPEDMKLAPHAGGADKYRAFLRELKPAIAARYRTTAESAILGESLGGLFVLETLLVAPDLFDRYIAISPSLWWNRQAVARSAAARFRAWTERPTVVYVTTADEPEMQIGAATFTAAIRDAQPRGLTWQYKAFPDEHHNTIAAISEPYALRAMFALPPATHP